MCHCGQGDCGQTQKCFLQAINFEVFFQQDLLQIWPFARKAAWDRGERNAELRCWALCSPIFEGFLNKTHSCQQSLWCFTFCNSINTVLRLQLAERTGYTARAVWSWVPRSQSNQTAECLLGRAVLPPALVSSTSWHIHCVQAGMAKPWPRPPFPLLLPDSLRAFNLSCLFWQI